MSTVMNRRYLERGVGLIELMISITLGLMIVAAIIQAYISSKSTFRMQATLAGLQENGRMALILMSQDIRMAGFMGCPFIDEFGPVPNPPIIIVKSPPSALQFDVNNIIQGFDNVSSSTSIYGTAASSFGNGVVPKTDVLVVRKAMNTGYSLKSAMTAPSSNISLDATSGPSFSMNGYALISDCQHADLFQISAVPTNSAGVYTIQHGSSTNTSANLSYAYGGAAAQVFGFQTITYFVGYTGRTTTAGNPIYALFKTSSPSTTSTTDELIEGVQDMQLRFGLDTNADGAADTYVDAPTATQWQYVVSVQVNLLLVSDDENIVNANSGIKQSNLNLTFNNGINGNGNAIVADNRLRQVFTATVAIRNRAEKRQ